MRRGTTALVILTAISSPAEVIDRIAVVVGDRAIKKSDIERDLRVTAFLNRDPLVLTAAARRKAAERLIDQAILKGQIAQGGYDEPSEQDAERLLADLRKQRFGGSEARLRQELKKYGLTPEQLEQHLLWQLTVLRFIDQRFRPGVVVSDEEVRAYYNEHLAELQKQFPRDSSFAALDDRIRTMMEAERVDRNFEQWVQASRKRTAIEFRQEAFR